MKQSSILVLLLLYLVPLVAAQEKAKPAVGSDSPERALAEFKLAVERGDVEKLGQRLTAPLGDALRKYGKPYMEAHKAFQEFEATLAEAAQKNVDLKFRNPLAASFKAFSEMDIQIVEVEPIGRDPKKTLARLSVLVAGKGLEEAVFVQHEGGQWRVTPPNDLLRSCQPLLDPATLEKRIEGMKGLKETFDGLKRQVKEGQIKNRDELLLELATQVAAKGLNELLR
jgi:hypothetical protein